MIKLVTGEESADNLRKWCVKALKDIGFPDEKLESATKYLMKNHLNFLATQGNDFNNSSPVFDFKAKVDSGTKLLGVSREKFMEAASRRPSLMVRRTETLVSHAKILADFLKVSKQEIIAAAMREPQILFQKPQTIGGHIDLIRVFSDESIIRDSTREACMKSPVILLRSDRSLSVRLLFARMAKLSDEPNLGLLTNKLYKIVTRMFDFADIDYDPERKIVNQLDSNDPNHLMIADAINQGLIRTYKLDAV